MSKRIGLVGYNCRSGLGEKNRQMATYLEIDRWLIKPHRNYPTLPAPECVDSITCPAGDPRKIEAFVKSVDVILFDETPYYPELIRIAKFHDKRIVCVLAQEWMPFPDQNRVDLFICPTKQAYDRFYKALPCTHFPWPVDTHRFEYRQRNTCNRFLFCNGNGGWKGRKGGDVIRDLLKVYPDIPLLVRSQKKEVWPSGVEVLPEANSNQEIYGAGDVLINCSHLDGTGLQPMEAMACGMPVISTSGLPWNEIPAIARIPAGVKEVKVKQLVDWYMPSAVALAGICRNLVGRDISKESEDARQWAESRSFYHHARELTAVVRGEQSPERFKTRGKK